MGTARSFNGTSDYLTNATSYLSGSTGPFTVMAWLKSASLTQTNAYALEAEEGGAHSKQWAFIYGFVNDGSGHARVEFYSPNAPSSFRTGSQITILDTGWHHICYRYLGAASEWAYFLDGTKSVISASLTSNLDIFVASPIDFSLGGAAAGTGNFYNGSIAEVALWATNLTDASITAIANTNGSTLASAFPANLLGYWPLGLASPDTDQSSANHPFTVHGTSIVTGPYTGSAGVTNQPHATPWWPN